MVLNQVPYLVGGSLSSTTRFSPDATLPRAYGTLGVELRSVGC